MPFRLLPLFLFSLSPVAFADPAPQAPLPPGPPYPFAIVHETDELETGRENCFLTVTTHYKSKKVETLSYAFEADSREDCAERRALFANNFSPREVLKKHVGMKWGRK